MQRSLPPPRVATGLCVFARADFQGIATLKFPFSSPAQARRAFDCLGWPENIGRFHLFRFHDMDTERQSEKVFICVLLVRSFEAPKRALASSLPSFASCGCHFFLAAIASFPPRTVLFLD